MLEGIPQVIKLIAKSLVDHNNDLVELKEYLDKKIRGGHKHDNKIDKFLFAQKDVISNLHNKCQPELIELFCWIGMMGSEGAAENDLDFLLPDKKWSPNVKSLIKKDLVRKKVIRAKPEFGIPLDIILYKLPTLMSIESFMVGNLSREKIDEMH